jgi:hypothetical protein
MAIQQITDPYQRRGFLLNQMKKLKEKKSELNRSLALIGEELYFVNEKILKIEDEKTKNN